MLTEQLSKLLFAQKQVPTKKGNKECGICVVYGHLWKEYQILGERDFYNMKKVICLFPKEETRVRFRVLQSKIAQFKCIFYILSR